MYWSPVIKGINYTKPVSGDRVRVTKAYRAPKVAPQILIVGNSRAEMALFPGHPSFGEARVYNQAMPGAGIRLQADYALNTLYTTPDLQRVIMSVDYLDFLVRRARFSGLIESKPPDYLFRLAAFTPSWSGSVARLREKAALLFSLDGLLASVLTVAQQGKSVNSIDPQGFNHPASYLSILDHEGINALFTQKLQELNRNMRGRHLVSIDPDGGQGSPQYSALSDLLGEFKEHGVQVQLFISPYHISYLHLLNDLGMINDFYAWKRKLLEVVESNGMAVELWDFSGPSAFIQEQVPVGSMDPMQWYWEPAHYRRKLGDKILETLATGEPTSGFGVRLTKEVIEEVIDGDRHLITQNIARWKALQKSLGIEIEPLASDQGAKQDSRERGSNTGTR
jgi:hypothetical protein